MATSSAKIEVGQPRLFTMGAVMMVNAYGLLLVAPVFAAMLAVSIIPFSVVTFVIPILMLSVAAFFLPFGLGNTQVTRLVNSFAPAPAAGIASYVVQLTLEPRIRTGPRAYLEDADDVGRLTFDDTGLTFVGDSVKASIPYSEITQVEQRNTGLRGGFVYGRRIKLVVPSLGEAGVLEIAERCSYFLPASRRVTRELCRCLTEKVAAARAPA